MPFFQRKKKEEAAKSNSKSAANASKEMKLKLSESMKTALLTMGIFTEEQADAIVKATQSHVPKDF